MAERTVELDAPVITDQAADALRVATDRADRAEAELAKLKSHPTPAAVQATSPQAAGQPSSNSQTPVEEGDLFAGQQPSPNTASSASARSERAANVQEAADSAPALERDERAAGDNAVHTDNLKQPPSPSSAANAAGYSAANSVAERGSADRAEAQGDGPEELRKDPMMAHLLDSLDAGTDIGHYGRLVFSMVARHFLPHEQVVTWLTKDNDFSTDQAQQMLHQVEGRDYSPPRRERLLEWQAEQSFQFIDAHDPDSGNLYRNLEFPKEIYQHIGHYQEAKAE